MTRVFYRDWNWESDKGIDPLPPNGSLPKRFAVAYFDYLDRLYRAEVWEQLSNGDVQEPRQFDVFRYEYFCDKAGKIVQKRSLGDEHEVIVDFSYDSAGKRVTETAWFPETGECATIERELSDDV